MTALPVNPLLASPRNPIASVAPPQRVGKTGAESSFSQLLASRSAPQPETEKPSSKVDDNAGDEAGDEAGKAQGSYKTQAQRQRARGERGSDIKPGKPADAGTTETASGDGAAKADEAPGKGGARRVKAGADDVAASAEMPTLPVPVPVPPAGGPVAREIVSDASDDDAATADLMSLLKSKPGGAGRDLADAKGAKSLPDAAAASALDAAKPEASTSLLQDRPMAAAFELAGPGAHTPDTAVPLAPVADTSFARALEQARGTETATPTFQIAEPMTSADFAPALGSRLVVMAQDGVQQAQLQINPPELGPITVQIALDGAQVTVDFAADIAATRERLESSLPELAGALREAGLTLAGGGVHEQAQRGAHGGASQHGGGGGQGQGWGRGEGGDGERTSVLRAAGAREPLSGRARGVVDLFA